MVVLFGSTSVSKELFDDKMLIKIAPKEPENKELFDVYLPMLTHAMDNGTYINCEGYVQFHKSNIQNSKDTKSLLELCSYYAQESYPTCKRVWESGLDELMGEITFESIQKESVKMELL